MSIDYRLVLPGDTTADNLAARAFPNQNEWPNSTADVLAANLKERYGFSVAVRSGDNGYLDVVADDGRFEWEADQYVSLTFTMDDSGRSDQMINMTDAVRRVLATGSEDAVLTFTAGYLLLTRFNGVVKKYNRHDWWDFYPGMDALIADGN